MIRSRPTRGRTTTRTTRTTTRTTRIRTNPKMTTRTTRTTIRTSSGMRTTRTRLSFIRKVHRAQRQRGEPTVLESRLAGLTVAVDVQHLYRPSHPGDQGSVYTD